MGVVIRQSFWGTAVAYAGVLVGYFNTLYIRPEFLDLSQIGVFNLVTANAMMISPICTAGMAGSVIKFFPAFDKKGVAHTQFFSFLWTVVLLVNMVILGLGYMFQGPIKSMFEENASLYTQYLAITGIIILVNSLFDLLYAFCRTFMNILMPSFFRDIFLRAGAIVLVGGYGLDYWSFSTAVQGLGIIYLLTLGLLLAFLMIRYKVRFTLSMPALDKDWRKRIFYFGGYSMLLAGSFSILNNVSYLQVSSMISDNANGIFTTCFFIGIIVEKPRRNMLKILSPLFSRAIQEGDMQQVHTLYRKGSMTMSVIGALLVIGILTNINDLFAFIPQGEKFATGFWVVVLVCIAKLLTMVFSFSQEIMVYSPYNRLVLYFQSASAGVLVLTNFLLLPEMGLTGAALGYLMAITLHTVLKFLFVYRKYALSPFSRKHLLLLVIAAAIFLIFWYLPMPLPALPSILVRAVLTTLVYVALIYFLKISDDINRLIERVLSRVFVKR